jgi:hypothetical protein
LLRLLQGKRDEGESEHGAWGLGKGNREPVFLDAESIRRFQERQGVLQDEASGFSRQPSAVSRQPSAVSRQPSGTRIAVVSSR